MKAIAGGKILAGGQVLTGKSLLFSDRILGIVDEVPAGAVVIDAGGLFVSAGFIDVHTHGIGGHDTMDGQAAVEAMSSSLPKFGVTSFLATTMTGSKDEIHGALSGVKTAVSQGASILGAHMEGPFLSAEYKGCHDPQYLLTPSVDFFKEFTDVVQLVTVAPELPFAKAFIEECKGIGVAVSLGHSNASYDLVMDAAASGARSFTHTFNAMRPLLHREPGCVGAAMDSGAFTELICDNLHVLPPLQRILLKQKGIGKILLVTDAMRAATLEDGEYTLGGLAVTVCGKEARLADGTIAGSVLTLNTALSNFIENTGVPVEQAVLTVTENPADMLSLTDRGRLAEGMRADILLFDEKIAVKATFINGEIYEG